MTNKILSKVFGWMTLGLLLTFVTGYYISTNTYALEKLLGGINWLIPAMIELILVIVLAARITKMSPTAAKICFIIYSVVSGITFSTIFVAYEITSIVYVFLLTAVIFAVFAIIGATTKVDLSKMGTYLLIGLIAVIICGVINIFIGSSTLELIISCVTVVIFVGLTAYDVQKILSLSQSNLIPQDNLAVYGALQLYLDFINIFLELLELFGKNDN